MELSGSPKGASFGVPFGSIFGAISGPVGAHFGVIFGPISGPFWDQFLVNSGTCFGARTVSDLSQNWPRSEPDLAQI